MLAVEVRHALRDIALDVALTVDAGVPLVLAGRSGAGKTTVLRAIAGVVRPDAGRVACGGDVWFDGAGRDVAPEVRRCALLPQDLALFGHLRAWQNVAFGLRGVRRRDRRAHAVAALERFGAGALADARPSELSGGERQRVALARSLAAQPRALLLDEPLSALDPRTRAAAAHELRDVLRAAAVPAIVVTHDPLEASLLGERLAVLDGGRIVQTGAPGEVAAAPSTSFVADFTGATVLHGVARADGELTAVDLDGGGGVLLSTDRATGPVAVVLRPWDIALGAGGSARTALRARVVAVTPLGPRVRVALALPQLLTAEVTAAAAAELDLRPGTTVTASVKATAARLLEA